MLELYKIKMLWGGIVLCRPISHEVLIEVNNSDGDIVSEQSNDILGQW